MTPANNTPLSDRTAPNRSRTAPITPHTTDTTNPAWRAAHGRCARRVVPRRCRRARGQGFRRRPQQSLSGTVSEPLFYGIRAQNGLTFVVIERSEVASHEESDGPLRLRIAVDESPE